MNPADLTNDARIGTFLKRNGAAIIDLQSITGGASAKQYYRLPGGRLLLDAAREPGTVQRYIDVAHLLHQTGVSAPVVYDADPLLELALIEDFGSVSMADALGSGKDKEL